MRRLLLAGIVATGLIVGWYATRTSEPRGGETRTESVGGPGGGPGGGSLDESLGESINGALMDSLDASPSILAAVEAAALAETDEARAYFADIALDIEYGEGGGVLRRWVDDIRLAVYGDPSPADRRELERIVDELNALLRGIRISIDSHRVNAEIHFAPERTFSSLEPNYRPLNYGFFWTHWNARHEITWARILIDTETMGPAERAHLIREELTQSLGLMQDLSLYEGSIFQVEWTTVSEFSPLDRALVYMLYDPRLRPGMRAAEALATLAAR